MSSTRTRHPLDQAAPPSPAPSVPPLLYSREQLCEVLGISRATLDRLQAAGKLPRPLRLGGQRRWRAEEIRQWIAHGMPPAAEWEARQAAG
jgi:excisionase family DNA binding protein